MIGSLSRPLTWCGGLHGATLWIISKVLKLFDIFLIARSKKDFHKFSIIWTYHPTNINIQAPRGCTVSPSVRPTDPSSWTLWSTWCCRGRSTRTPGGGCWRRSRSATVLTSSSSSETANSSSEPSTPSIQTQKRWDLSSSLDEIILQQFCGISFLLVSELWGFININLHFTPIQYTPTATELSKA